MNSLKTVKTFLFILTFALLLSSCSANIVVVEQEKNEAIEVFLKDVPSTPLEPISEYNRLQLNSDYVLVYDLDEEKTLFVKGDIDKQIYPASLTKLYTTYVALKYMQPDEEILVGQEELTLVRPRSSMAYIGAGARLRVERIIEAMMLPSGNDAAYILAVATGRKIAGENISAKEAVKLFMEKVNESAKEDKLLGTHFQSPDGYHEQGHYTTMADLLEISKLALSNETITKYTGLYQDVVQIPYGIALRWTNTNRLLYPSSKYYIPQTIGLKTGYTEAAGYCLASAADFNGQRVLVLTLHCEKDTLRFQDAYNIIKLYESEAS